MVLAWAIRLLALPLTPLLRRFFCSAEPPLPLRFSLLGAESDALAADGEERSAPPASLSGDGDLVPALSFGAPAAASGMGLVSGFEAPELELLPPNILFSRPPWAERLRRLLPARLVGGNEIKGV